MTPLPQLVAPIGRAQELNDLLELFSAVRTTRKGQTVFLLGGEGMHRKATARKFLQAVGNESNVITASVQFHDREKHPRDWEKLVSEDARWQHQYAQFAPIVEKYFPKAIKIAGLPWLALAVQLLAKSKSLLEALKTQRSFALQDDPFVLKEFMRHVSQHYHVAILLEDLTYADSPWIDILRRVLNEMHRDLPLLLIATVEANAPLEKIAKDNLLESQWLVQDAVARQVGQARFFAPLTLDDIHHLFPMRIDGSLARRLHEWTDGIPELIQVLWNEWVRERVVEYSPTGTLQARADTKEWVWGPAKDIAEQQVEQLLDEDSPFETELVFSILQLGALEGSPFTAEAVAEACQGDANDLIDFFDDYLVESETNPRGILNEAGWTTVLLGETEKELALYSFRFPFHEHVFVKYPSDAQTRGNAFALVRALEKAYYPQTHLHARKLARLWTLAGNEHRAREYKRMLAISNNIEILRWQVSVLHQFAQDKFDLYRLFRSQINLGEQLFGHVQYLEIVRLFQRAVNTAKRLENVQDQALALYYLGRAWSYGGEFANARQALETSRAFALRANARSTLAATLYELGSIESDQGNYPAAREYLEQALALERELGDKGGIAYTLQQFGVIEFKQGNYPAARAHYEQGLALERESPGGQAGSSPKIENYLGFPAGLSGLDLTRRALTQAQRFGAEILATQQVSALRVQDPYRVLVLDDGAEIVTKTVLITTGASFHILDLPGAAELTGKGVYYGAAYTEAMFFKDRDVFVVGGANSAAQNALFLARYCRKVTVLVRSVLSTSQYLTDALYATPNVQVRLGTSLVALHGTDKLEAVTIHDRKVGHDETIPGAALFVFIGQRPRSEFAEGMLRRGPKGHLLTGPALRDENGKWPPDWKLKREPMLLETNIPGVFAAGDVRQGARNRVAAAAGEGSTAISMVHEYLTTV
ncbi:MAG: FAD-dependent oxidoreductase [Chloroflexi bacterium]|nr:FAD-dependent oxidoreductase [Chloroflexota bacterium]